MNSEQIKKLLALEAHPVEGGSFRRTYTSAQSLLTPRGQRPAGSAIYYLLEPGTFSEIHRLASDEIFHFYLGDPVEMLQLWPDGSHRRIVLGPCIEAEQSVQALVPAGVWQGTRLLGSGQVALMGCTVCPGFDFADYESGVYDELVALWPGAAEWIRALTRR
jgi:predicted cupin superfamily sugar epimerase